LPGDLLKPYINTLNNNKPAKVIIAANLPYLNPEEMKEASIKKEPVQALLSGSDGLWHYKRLFFQLSSYLKTNYSPIEFSLYCEINPEQYNNIYELAKQYLPEALVVPQKDLSGQIRFAFINIAHRPNLQ
jgi:methylase of polypeptide subunit release factors